MADGTLGQRMRTARKRADLSMAEVGRRVAEAINRPEGPYSAQAVQQWEVGTKKKGETIHTQPDLDTLLAFANVVGCEDLNWLLRGIDTNASGGVTNIPTRGRVVAVITAEQAMRQPIEIGRAHV